MTRLRVSDFVFAHAVRGMVVSLVIEAPLCSEGTEVELLFMGSLGSRWSVLGVWSVLSGSASLRDAVAVDSLV